MYVMFVHPSKTRQKTSYGHLTVCIYCRQEICRKKKLNPKIKRNKYPSHLKFSVRGEFEGQPPEGEGEYEFFVVVDSGMCGTERLVDLLDGGRHLRAVEQDVA